MIPMITHLSDINDVWLTSVLQHPIHVTERRSNPAFSSAIVHLTVRSESSDVPERLIVKLNANGDGEFEIKFYQLTTAQDRPPLLHPRTLAFAYENGFSYIIQEDLSATHRTPVTRDEVLAEHNMPSEVHLQQMTETIAR